MKIRTTDLLVPVGILAEEIGAPLAKVLKAAESIGIEFYDKQIIGVGPMFNATNCVRIFRALATAGEDVVLPGHPALVGEFERLAAEKVNADA